MVLLQFKLNWTSLVERLRREMKELMLPKLDVKSAKVPITLKIVHQGMMKHLRRPTTHNLDNHSNLQEDLGKLLQVIIKETMEIPHIKKGGKLWMTP